MLKKLLNLSFLVILFFFMIPSVFAAECTDDELGKLKELASKIKFSNEFQKSEEGNHSFNVKAYNLSNKVYLSLPNGTNFITDKSEDDLGNYLDGEKIYIEIYASENTVCDDELLITTTVELPIYNEYSERNECKTNKHLDVCKEWGNTKKITEEQFLQIIKQEQNNVPQNDDKTFAELLKHYSIYIIVVSIVLATFIVIYNILRNRNRKKIDI